MLVIYAKLDSYKQLMVAFLESFFTITDQQTYELY